MEKISRKELRIHAICWSVYIFVEVVLAGAITGKFKPFSHYFLFYVLNIGMFYFHSLLIMPVFSLRSPYRPLLFLIALMTEGIIYLALATLNNNLLEFLSLRDTKFDINFRYIGITVWRASYFIMYGTGYFYLKKYLGKKELENQKAIEIERLNFLLISAEKDFLRSQINPHLLFNTLNFINHSTKYHPENARTAISSLSDLMEYALEGSKEDFVPLEKEIRQVENMIRLNQLRFENTLNLHYLKEIDDDHTPILPIVLLTLVENIFKHGIFNDPDYPAIIEIKSSSAEFFFSTSNLTKFSGENREGRTGLRNTSARLKQAYPDRHSFEYGMNGANFEVELKIFIKND